MSRRASSARRRVVLAGAAACLVAAVLGGRWLLGSAWLEGRVARAVATATREAAGCELTLGRVELDLPQVRLEDLELRCGSDRISAPRATARLALPALLLGRTRVARLDVEEPVAILDASGPLATRARRQEPAGGGGAELGRVTASRAALVVTGLPGGATLRVGRSELRARLGRASRVELEASDVAVEREGRSLDLPRVALALVSDSGGFRLADVEAEARGIGVVEGGLACVTADGGAPACRGELEGDLSLAALGELVAPGAAPRARGVARVRAEWDGSAWPLLDVESEDVTIESLPRDLPPVAVRDLRARLVTGSEGIALEALQARALGGSLSATGELRLRGLLLSLVLDASDVLLSELPVPRLAARAELRAQVSLPLEEPSRARGGADVVLRPPRLVPPDRVVVEGTASVSLADGAARLRALRARAAGLELEAQGSASFGGPMDLRASLRGDAAGVAALWPEGPLARLHACGELEAEADLRGELSAPLLALDLDILGCEIAELPLGHVAAHVTREEAGAWRVDPLLLDGPAGRLDATMLVAPDRLEGTWTAARLDAPALAAALRPGVALEGELEGEGALSGTPARPVVSGRLSAPRAVVAGAMMTNVILSGRVDSEGLVLDEAAANAGRGTFRARGALPFREGQGELGLAAEGLDLAALAPSSGLHGELSLQAVVAGSLAVPRLVEPARVVARGLRFGPVGPMELDGTADLLGRQLVVQAEASGPSGMTGRARLRLDEPHDFELDGQLPPLALQVPADVTFARVHVQAAGALARIDETAWTARVEDVRACRAGWTVEALAPLEMGGRGRHAMLVPLRVRAAGLELELEGEALVASPPIWSLSASVDAQAATAQAPGLPLTLTADLRGRAEARGTGADARLAGQVAVENGMLRVEGVPQALEELRAELALDGERVVLREASALLGGGQVRALGEAALDGSFTLRAVGKAVSLAPPRVLRLRSLADFDLTWAGDASSSRLTGDVDVLRAALKQDVPFALARRGAWEPPAADHGPLSRVALDVAVRAPEGDVWIDNDLGRVELGGDLRVRGTLARPSLDGSVATVDRGLLVVQGVRYRLESAALDFSPSRPDDPEVRLDASTQVGAHAVSLSVSGRLSSPRVELSSEPELPRERIAALLLSRGLVGGASASTDRIIDSAAEGVGPGSLGGLDLLHVDPVFLEGQGNRSSRVIVGQRLGGRTFVAHSLDLSGAEESTTEVRWIAGRWLLRAAREASGSMVGEWRWLRRLNRAAVRKASAARASATPVALCGAPPEREADLRAILEREIGWTADERTLARAARAAREELSGTHPFCRVRCAPAGEELAVVTAECEVEAGPRASLEVANFEGLPEPLSPRELARLRSAAWNDLADFGRVAEAGEQVRESLVERLRDDGRWHAFADVSVHDDGSDSLRLVAALRGGPSFRVADVALEGELADRAALLRELEGTGKGRWTRPPLTPSLLLRDRETLLAALVAEGHLDARVEPAALQFRPDANRAAVTYRIDAGPLIRAESFSVTGLAGELDPAVRARLEARIPGVVKPRELDEIAEALVASLDASGHADAAVGWRLDRDLSLVTFEAAPGPTWTIGDVRVEGRQRTRPRVIARSTELERGAPLSRASLAEARRGVLRLGTFSSASVREAPADPGGGARDVLVRVRERDDVEMSVGAGWMGDSGPRVSFALADRNVRGRALGLGLTLRASEADSQVELLAGWKNAWAPRLDLLLTAGAREEHRTSFVSRKAYLAARATRALSDRTTLQARYSLERYRLDDLEITDEDDEGVLGGLGVGLARDTRDDIFIPRRGSLSSLDAKLNAPIFGSTTSFTRALGQHAHWQPIGRRVSVLGSVRAGVAVPFSDDEIPASERFFVGGASSVRGFREDSIGPLDPVTGEPTGGEASLVGTCELRYHARRWLAPFAFVDAGNAWEDVSELDGELRLGAGAGLLLATPIGPVQLSYGVNLDPRDDEDPGRFHFVFGTSF